MRHSVVTVGGGGGAAGGGVVRGGGCGVRGVCGVFMLRPLSLTCATVINRFNYSYFSSVHVSSSLCCYMTLSCPLVGCKCLTCG